VVEPPPPLPPHPVNPENANAAPRAAAIAAILNFERYATGRRATFIVANLSSRQRVCPFAHGRGQTFYSMRFLDFKECEWEN